MEGGSLELQHIQLPTVFSNDAIEDGCGNLVYI
jgi:hypothetical protein